MVSLGPVAERARVVVSGGLHSEMREKGLAANAAAQASVTFWRNVESEIHSISGSSATTSARIVSVMVMRLPINSTARGSVMIILAAEAEHRLLGT